jgi:hypothetical protein
MRFGAPLTIVIVLVASGLTACKGDDVARLCSAESGAHASAVTDWSAVKRWIDGHMRTSQGRSLALELDQLPPADRRRVLQDRAADDGLLACPLAEAWSPGPRADPYVQDLIDFCAMTPPLDRYVVALVDGGTRMDLMRAWADAHARTPALFNLVARLAASPPRERGPLLHAEVDRQPAFEEDHCQLADVLDLPGP